MATKSQADLEGLLVLVANRDSVAFRQLYDVTASRLLGTVLRIVRNKPIAEEVLQEVFLRIWQNAASFAPQTAPASVWLNAIARNRAIDVVRQASTSPSWATNETNWFERLAEDRDREQDMIDTATLRRCLAKLDQSTRSCVLLAYYEGFSREELATRFDRPVNTIKTWLHRSLATLRDCLDGSPA